MASTLGKRLRASFDRRELLRLGSLLGVVAALHIIGFGLFVHYNSIPKYHSISDAHGTLLYAGAAGLAYVFGLRHAFDADHISAIDDTTRLLLQKGRKPLGVGLAFSLGHSTVVLALSVGVAFAANAAAHFQQGFAATGGLIGTLVSGTFLYIVAIFNFVILAGIWKVWRQVKSGSYEEQHLEELLASRGFMNRIFKGRYNRFISHSWQMYPVGVLFGLGFDTATEVGLLGISASAAAGSGTGGATLPPLAIIALPIIFAAGMSLMDTIDGAFMAKAYDWAFGNPVRKIYYNISTTGLSIFVAFVVGTLELIGVVSDRLGVADQEPWRTIDAIDLNRIGYFIVGIFLLTWIGSVVWWKVRKLEDRYASAMAPSATVAVLDQVSLDPTAMTEEQLAGIRATIHHELHHHGLQHRHRPATAAARVEEPSGVAQTTPA
ncbi:HoxN/HupN/NixA family nickel/cobalt transporter [Streptacidiphilus rugosus]|uniref:HoxN/HupN/NixA family nickel/cobalt transporter n=1 Tax=Streptacidiphilus rugosus TaxID=405783 RepID=UPI000A0119C5|nr:HoxN/HupN/NixA family nickel/cobalt transporter [Streptacidiphilus rugosus]